MLSGTVLAVNIEVEPEYEAELNRWYDEEHLPSLARVPAVHGAQRFVALEGEPKYLALYELEAPEVRQSEAWSRAVETPWTHRLRPHYTAQAAVYEPAFPADGPLRGASWGAEMSAIMVMRLGVAPERVQDLRDWYDQEHLAALAGVPGTIAARRFEAVAGEPLFLAIYALTEPAVQASPAWKQAIDTPWSAQARTWFERRWRMVCQPLGPRLTAESAVGRGQ